MTKKLASKFREYGQFHTTRGNAISHYFGIPLIVISIFGLLSRVTFGNEAFRVLVVRPDLGWVVFSFALGFYFWLDWKIALPFSLVLAGMYMIGRSLPLELLVMMQITGWIAQFVGHMKYEKNSPAFYKNAAHMLIGPLWVFSKAIRYGQAV